MAPSYILFIFFVVVAFCVRIYLVPIFLDVLSVSVFSNVRMEENGINDIT